MRSKVIGLGMVGLAVMAVMSMCAAPTTALWMNTVALSTGNTFEAADGSEVVHCNPGDTIAFDVVSAPASTNLSKAELRADATSCNGDGDYTVTEQLVLYDGDDDTEIVIDEDHAIYNWFWCDNVTDFIGGDDPYFFPESIQEMYFFTNDSTPDEISFYLNWTEKVWSPAVSSAYIGMAYSTLSWSLTLTFDEDGEVTYEFPQTRINSNEEVLTVAPIYYTVEAFGEEVDQNQTWDSFNLTAQTITKYQNVPILTDGDAMFVVTSLEEYTGYSIFSQNFPYDNDELHPWDTTIEQISATTYRVTCEVPINEVTDVEYFWVGTNIQSDTSSAIRIDVGDVQATYPFPMTPFLVSGIAGMACLVLADKAANSKKDKAAVYILVIIGLALAILAAYIVIQHYFMPSWPRLF